MGVEMSEPGFIRDPAFGILCDLVAEGRTVFLTGAGLSRGLVNLSGDPAPGWHDVLAAVRKRRLAEGKLIPGSDEDEQIRIPLDMGVLGRHSIMAATLLCRDNNDLFLDTVDKALALKPLAQQDRAVLDQKLGLLRAALDLQPLGFVTFNVDQGHEMLLEELGVKFDVADPLNDPRGTEHVLRRVLRGEQKTLFLVKAHGSLRPRGGTGTGEIAFTHSQYRDLLSRNPIYRAFMGNLLTHFGLVSVGFGMTDLDFDLFRDELIGQYGGPIRQHVVLEKKIGPREIKHDPARRTAYINAAELKALVDIWTLYVKDHTEYPLVLQEVGRRPGPNVKRWVDQCMSDTTSVRSQAHDQIRGLGEFGKRMVAAKLSQQIIDMLKKCPTRRGKKLNDLSELVYALGALHPKDPSTKVMIRDILFQVVRDCPVKEPIAHALSVLFPFVGSGDLPALYAMGHSLDARGIFDLRDTGDPDDRLPVYLECLILRTRARDLSDPEAAKAHQSFLRAAKGI